MMYLQLVQAGIEGDIVLAEADIKYLAPERGELVARCDLAAHPDFGAALVTLRRDGKAKFPLLITVGDPENPVVRLSGRYAARVRQ